jgi:hypothetical protein
MKVEFDKDGVLVISPENNIEAYALKQWNNGWNIKADPLYECTSVLCIHTELNNDSK